MKFRIFFYFLYLYFALPLRAVDRCEFALFLASEDGNRTAAISNYYRQILSDVVLPELNQSTLQIMLKNGELFQLPGSAVTSSDSAAAALRDLREMIQSDLESDPELAKHLLQILKSVAGASSESNRKQTEHDRKSASPFKRDILWPFELNHVYTHGEWTIGIPEDTDNRNIIWATRDGKKFTKVEIPNEFIPYEYAIDKKDGSLISIVLSDSNKKTELYRIPMFDDSNNPVKVTSPKNLSDLSHIFHSGLGQFYKELIFSPSGDRLALTVGHQTLVMGDLSENHFQELTANPLSGQVEGNLQWVGENHVWAPISNGSKIDGGIYNLNLERTGRVVYTHDDYPIVSPDGKHLFLLQYNGKIPEAIRFAEKNGSQGKDFLTINYSTFSLGHKRVRTNSESPWVVDSLLFPRDPNLIVQLRFLRNGSHAHELVLRNASDFNEIGKLALPVTDAEPIAAVAGDGQHIELRYIATKKNRKYRTLLIDIEELR